MSELERPGLIFPASTVRTNSELDDLFRFMYHRQEAFVNRFIEKKAPPWSSDSIIQGWHFTNVYPFLDRGTQYILRDIAGVSSVDDKIFRVLVYRIFNKVETFERIKHLIFIKDFNSDAIRDILIRMRDKDKQAVFTNSFMVTGHAFAGNGGPGSKIDSYVRGVLKPMHYEISNGLCDSITDAVSLSEVHKLINNLDGYGGFLSWVACVDLVYGRVVPFDLNRWVFCGPGCKKALRRIHPEVSEELYPTVLRYLVDTQEEHFKRLGLLFQYYMGKRLDLACFEWSLCELQKYWAIRLSSADRKALGFDAKKRHFLPKSTQDAFDVIIQ